MPSMLMTVSVADLKKLGACSEDVQKFKAEFGSYVEDVGRGEC